MFDGEGLMAVATLVGLVSSYTLPLTVAVDLFDLEIDSLLACNRWLWVSCEVAPAFLDQFLEQCARNLLGADPWKNPSQLRSELGWHLSGWQRALRDAACRRARV